MTYAREVGCSDLAEATCSGEEIDDEVTPQHCFAWGSMPPVLNAKGDAVTRLRAFSTPERFIANQ